MHVHRDCGVAEADREGERGDLRSDAAKCHEGFGGIGNLAGMIGDERACDLLEIARLGFGKCHAVEYVNELLVIQRREFRRRPGDAEKALADADGRLVPRPGGNQAADELLEGRRVAAVAQLEHRGLRQAGDGAPQPPEDFIDVERALRRLHDPMVDARGHEMGTSGAAVAAPRSTARPSRRAARISASVTGRKSQTSTPTSICRGNSFN